MKIKQACELTGLTERTIRFYIERGLIAPSSNEMNGRIYYEYENADISLLENISILRKAGFSIQAIQEMGRQPQEIDTIVELHRASLLEEAQELSGKIEVLEGARGKHFNELNELCEAIRTPASRLELPHGDISPDFSRFDTESEAEKQDAYLDHLANEKLKERRGRFLSPVTLALKIASAVAVLLLAAYAFSLIPHSIHREYTGAKFRTGAQPLETLQALNIRIEGKLYTPLFQSPVFKGRIEIEGVEDSRKYDAIEVVFHEGLSEEGVLAYAGIGYEGSDPIPYINTYGMLRTDKAFSYFLLRVFEPEGASQKTLEDLVIVAPAEDASQGLLKWEEHALPEK